MINNNNDDLNIEIQKLKQQLQTQKEIENQLRIKYGFSNLLVETLPNPIFYKDEKGIYIGCNKAFELFVGRKRTDIIGKTVYDMESKEIADKYHEMDEQLFTKGGTQHYEWKVKSKTGRILEVIFDKTALIGDDGRVAGLIGIITDITNSKQESRKVSEEKFKKISSTANDAIIQMNEKGEIVFWNPAAEKIFGYTWEEVMAKDLHQLLVPNRYLSEFRTGFQKFKQNGQGPVVGKKVELFALRKDGSEFEIELSLSSYMAHGIWNAVGIVRDISIRKAIEKEKEVLLDNLKIALDEIKTLKGIVPICSHCKKIRDDKGFWNHLEIYIQKHSEAEFSHGICPDCIKKRYPGVVTD